MTDTPPEVDERYRQMLLALSPGERVRMVCRMFATGRALMKAGLASKGEAEQRREIFTRLYGDLFAGHDYEAILQGLNAGPLR